MKLQKKMMLAFAASIALCVTAVHAQVQNENAQSAGPISPLPPTNSGGSSGVGKRPVPAARGVSSATNPRQYDPAQVEPDTNTLSGAEAFGVGSLEHSRNIFDPSLFFSSLGQSGMAGTAGQSGLLAVNMVGGSLNFNRIWDRYRMTATYNGGETFYQGPQPNESFHTLAVAQEIEWNRWRLHLRDDFEAAPGAAFGGSGTGGPGLIGQSSSSPGGSLNSIGQGFVPSETIQTGQATRYRNTVLGQAEYSFSRRSAFSFSGSFGLLHFTDADFVSNHQLKAQAGYDYLLDPRNSIAVLVSYNKIDYTGTTTSTVDYMAGLAYGRKITGRLAFQATGGPEQIRSTGSGNGNFRLMTWAVNSALTYERRRTGLSLGYERGLTGGSGVFFGTIANTFSGSLHHQFSRFWFGFVNGGYAFNRSLAPSGAATSSFTNWFIGTNAARQVGRHARVGFNYGLQRQDSQAVCPVVSCGGTGFQQSFGMTVNWHLRPVE